MTQPVVLFLADEAETIALGEDLALALKPGDCLALSGDLGAGKSTLARAFLRAMADHPDLDVPSPTFTLVQSYDLRIPVSHFDLYRLGNAGELDELGLEEALSEGICLVEWPEMGESGLPKDRLTARFEHDRDGRLVTFSGPEAVMDRIARSLLIRNFLRGRGFASARRRYLNGDASSRAYERILADGRAPMILMDAPTHMPGPILEDGKYYQQLAHIAETVMPFVAIAQLLRDRGFCAPEVYESDVDNGVLLIEDLGNEGIVNADHAPIAARYLESVRLLAQLHSAPVTREIELSETSSHIIPDFDRGAMTIETRLLIDWYLPWKRGAPASDLERIDYAAIWDGLIGLLAVSEKSLVLRDFHSPNIIWREQRQGLDRIGLIDFQDAMIGPSAYDVAAIVQDARVTIDDVLAGQMLSHYATERERLGAFDAALFMRDFHLMSAQRNCKLLGIWVRLMQRDDKAGYMKHMPRTLCYLETALAHEALAPLRGWCKKAGII